MRLLLNDLKNNVKNDGKTRSLVYLLLSSLFSFAFQLSAFSQIIIDPENYTFPKINPLKAAVSTSFIGTPNGRWLRVKMPIYNRRLSARVRGIKTRPRIEFRYLWPEASRDKNELIYILTGFSGRSEDPKANFIARKLTDQGFHTIILPSIFTPQFIGAASERGIVGEFSEDAWDYFHMMKKATKIIQDQLDLTFLKKHMLGFSYGALTAGFVARIDKSQNFLKLDKEILINPPTDLLAAAKTVDRYSLEQERMGGINFGKLLAKVGLTSLYYRRYIPTPYTYESYLGRINLNKEQMMALVGSSLRSELPMVRKAIYATLLHDHGNLMGVKATDAKTLEHFLKEVLLPYSIKNVDPKDTLQKIGKRNSLYELEPYFSSNQNTYLIHNADDFLIRPGDIDFFSKTFNDRFILYPWGGHMGNLWHDQNIGLLIKLLEDQAPLYPLAINTPEIRPGIFASKN